jgi:hypothetical protein
MVKISDDGERWGTAQPLGWQGGIDFEVTGTGPYEWFAYDEDVLVGKGKARTRLGLGAALMRARKRLS